MATPPTDMHIYTFAPRGAHLLTTRPPGEDGSSRTLCSSKQRAGVEVAIPAAWLSQGGWALPQVLAFLQSYVVP